MHIIRPFFSGTHPSPPARGYSKNITVRIQSKFNQNRYLPKFRGCSKFCVMRVGFPFRPAKLEAWAGRGMANDTQF
jgi:hypothetical protein